MTDSLSIAVIATQVGKTPKDITYSFVFDEIYRLAKRGLRIHVIRQVVEKDLISYGIYYHGIKDSIYPAVFKEILKNIGLYPLISLARSPRGLLYENLYSLRVKEIVKMYNIDLVHAHFAYPAGFIGLLAKKEIKKPLVVTLHGYDILVEPTVRYGIRLKKRYDVIIRRVLNYADAIIVASKAVYNEASKLCKVKRKIHIIPNGVDTKRFNPNIDGSILRKKLNIEDKFVVFTAKYHRPPYGIEYLISSIPIVLKKRKDVIFVIGGDGPLRPCFERLVLKLGVKNNVIFTGMISREYMPYYYAMSDVVVIPSLQEAWGLIVTEAMATGKPVIGTKVGGIVDQIIDGYNGFLVPPRDPKAIADKILWFIENPKEVKRMGLNARRFVEKNFDIKRRIDNIIKLYKKLLG